MWQTTIETPLGPAEVVRVLRAEIREPRPILWIFSTRYAGPDERRLTGMVGESTFEVQRYPSFSESSTWSDGMRGGVVRARGTVEARGDGSVIRLHGFVAPQDAMPLLIMASIIGLTGVLTFPPLMCVAVIMAVVLFVVADVEWTTLTRVLAEITAAK